MRHNEAVGMTTTVSASFTAEQVAVILLNYNNAGDTVACLRSLHALKRPGQILWWWTTIPQTIPAPQ